MYIRNQKKENRTEKKIQERTTPIYVIIYVAFIWHKQANNKISGIMGDPK